MGTRVHQEDEDKLKATVKQKEKDRTVTGSVTAVQTVGSDLKVEVSQDPFGSLVVEQGTAANLKATVTQAAKDRTVTNDTAANLKGTVTQAEKDRTVTGTVTIEQTNSGNCEVEVKQPFAEALHAEVEQTYYNRTVTCDTAANLKCEPTQTTAANLKATVTPSGDMARKAYYDRNSENESQYYSANVGAGSGNTVRWTYTVPSDHKAMITFYMLRVYAAIATAGRIAVVYMELQPSGGSYGILNILYHLQAAGIASFDGRNDTTIMFDGDAIRCSTENTDTIAHVIAGGQTIVEFDE